jgi:hypothetical protein
LKHICSSNASARGSGDRAISTRASPVVTSVTEGPVRDPPRSGDQVHLSTVFGRLLVQFAKNSKQKRIQRIHRQEQQTRTPPRPRRRKIAVSVPRAL